jgi:hypothetical protein
LNGLREIHEMNFLMAKVSGKTKAAKIKWTWEGDIRSEKDTGYIC